MRTSWLFPYHAFILFRNIWSVVNTRTDKQGCVHFLPLLWPFTSSLALRMTVLLELCVLYFTEMLSVCVVSLDSCFNTSCLSYTVDRTNGMYVLVMLYKSLRKEEGCVKWSLSPSVFLSQVFFLCLCCETFVGFRSLIHFCWQLCKRGASSSIWRFYASVNDARHHLTEQNADEWMNGWNEMAFNLSENDSFKSVMHSFLFIVDLHYQQGWWRKSNYKRTEGRKTCILLSFFLSIPNFPLLIPVASFPIYSSFSIFSCACHLFSSSPFPPHAPVSQQFAMQTEQSSLLL